MSYTLQYGQIAPYLTYLAGGAWITLQLAAFAFVIGSTVGLLCASVLEYGPTPARALVRAYVVFMLNTPLLVQIFFLYFALTDWGLVLGSYQAVLIGMALNEGAYMTQIQRAGFRSIRRVEVDAAETLGFARWQTIRYLIVPHICRVLFPPLSNQYIILTMTSSIAAIFGVEELSGRTYNIDGRTFRSLEVFSVSALYYVVLTSLASAALYAVGRYCFRIKGGVY